MKQRTFFLISIYETKDYQLKTNVSVAIHQISRQQTFTYSEKKCSKQLLVFYSVKQQYSSVLAQKSTNSNPKKLRLTRNQININIILVIKDG